MTEVADHTLEYLRRIYNELLDTKREQQSMSMRLVAVEQHMATNQMEMARMSADIAQIRSDVVQIKRHLDLVDA